MQSEKIAIAAGAILAASTAMADSAPKPFDLNKIYAHYEKAGHSSLELMDSTKRALISGIVLDVNQSFNGNSILKVNKNSNSQ